MWPLPKPRHDARSTYETCISNTKEMGSEKRRTRLDEATDAVQEASRRFREAATSRTLHALEPEDFRLPAFAPKEKVTTWIYTYGMVAGPGRDIYNELMEAPQDQRCPLCGHGVVHQLDHHLPKTHFHALCVEPLNLIPACADCNGVKNAALAKTAEQTPLHPYLDDIDTDTWLAAKVVHEEGSIRLHFYVDPLPHWDTVLTARAQHHFKLFGLRRLYAIQANRFLGEIRGQLPGQLATGGPMAVRNHLLTGARSSLNSRPNSWIGITYQALADDTVFCAGAFGL